MLVLRRSPVTPTQLFGYGLAFLGVCWYNYRKVQAMKQAAAGAAKAPDKAAALEARQEAKQPLLQDRTRSSSSSS